MAGETGSPQTGLELPIDRVLPDLCAELKTGCRLILSAEPGAGKTTRVPMALFNEQWLGGKKILMLEPRRLAARLAARFIAAQVGCRVGGLVGYRTRGDSAVSSSTRLEILTDGLFTRILMEDPALSGVGLVIFDEFHERGLQTDVGLAFALEAQESLRPDLRLLLMSATIDAADLTRRIAGARSIFCPGRVYPVEERYLPGLGGERIEASVVRAIRQALRDSNGDILAFLPGRAEIGASMRLLEPVAAAEPLDVFPLHADVGLEGQRAALAPAPSGRRKVILATSIAETSLTIDGVCVVVDSGVTRISRFDPVRAMSGLATVPVSQAAAEQRKGRAGRQGPGVCYRLWEKGATAQFPRFLVPEILREDLAGFALDLAVWGERDSSRLFFLDPPPEAFFAQSRQLLRSLGALDDAGGATAHGKEMARFGVHPRLAHMLLWGRDNELGALACDAAALLEERDILQGQDCDISLSLRWCELHRFRNGGRGGRASIVGRIDQQASRLRRALGIGGAAQDEAGLGALVAQAFPDRIAQRRAPNSSRYLLTGGAGAEIPPSSQLRKEKYLVVTALDGMGQNARVFTAEPVAEDELRRMFAARVTAEDEVFWNPETQSVVSRVVEKLGAVALSEGPSEGSSERIASVLLQALRESDLGLLPWDRESEAYCARLNWLRRFGKAGDDWPEATRQALASRAAEWLAPFLGGRRSARDLLSLPLLDALKSLLSYEQQRRFELLAPAFFPLPSGSRATVEYPPDGDPKTSLLLQELFGQTETPRIGAGEVPLTIELLSPAKRPLQVTKDLRSFWQNSYPEIRREMQRKYPRHVWPEDPLQAVPVKHGLKRNQRRI